MKKLLSSIVILTNLLLPVRFGLAELKDPEAHSHGRRVELARRLGQARQTLQISAVKANLRLISPDKKYIRRPVYTRDTDLKTSPDAIYFALEDRAAMLARPVPVSSSAVLVHPLRAPPALA